MRYEPEKIQHSERRRWTMLQPYILNLNDDTFCLLWTLVREQSVARRVLEHLADTLASPGGTLEILFGADFLSDRDTL